MEYWRGKYKALVDGGEGDVVEGVAFEVEGGEEEEALRFFETEMYEVVRCGIRMGGGGGKVLGGLTFRFARREQLG